MEVYIEYVIIDNFVINYVLLFSTIKTLKTTAKKWQIWVSSAIGTVGSVAMPFVPGSMILMFFLKLILGFSMTLVVTINENFLRTIVNFLVFVAYTFFLGGACIGILSLTRANIINFTTMSYSGFFPIGVMVLSIFLFVRFVHHMVNYINERRAIAPYLQTIEICINGKIEKIEAFVDSGNRLFDPKTNLPVTVVTINCLKKFLKKDQIESITKRNCENSELSKAHFVQVDTIANSGTSIFVFKPEYVKVAEKEKECMLGVSFERFNDLVSYDALLNPAMIEKEN